MLNETDQQLLERFGRGDEAAFEAIFRQYYAQVCRVAYGLTRSHEAADDLAQEAFVALYRRPPQLLPDTSLVAWLCRVALNRGANTLRGARREQERIARIGVDTPPDPFDDLLRDEQRALVRTVLAQLPERQAQILALRYAGLSYTEIASALGVAPGSVGTLLARAERAFAAAYSAIVPDPRSIG
ncbi:MAG: sigma-70 family RNA polymerase sigma factor [Roseiflexaceae bacterium]|nr:sigma-70 family RNA polymerase sigma factor [Roseiflexaceae bacterium]